jgi:hypothetical protein
VSMQIQRLARAMSIRPSLSCRRSEGILALVAFSMSERVPSMAPDVVTIKDIEVREVLAHA